MIIKLQNGEDDKDKYVFQRRGGKSIIERCPVFTPDGESLAVIVENTVRLYNIQTGDCGKVLETEGYQEDLIAIEFPENDNYYLYGCSETGCVTVWTWENGAVLREVKLNIAKDVKVLTFNMMSQTECLLTVGSPSYKNIFMGLYSLKTGNLQCDYKGTQPIFYDMIKVALGWYNGDRFAALTNGTKLLFIQNLAKPFKREQISNHNSIRIMAVAAHNGTVAITDALGRVSLLRGNLFDNRSNIAREVLHWHFLPLMAVAFSLQGNYLYTGGLEKVLVKWTLSNIASKANERAFMPRLPGLVKYIAASSTHVAFTLSNNSVIIGNCQLYATSTILECGGISPALRTVGGSLVYNARLGGLLMPGRTGHLQLFSTKTNKVLYNIDVTEMNDLPAERHNLIPLDTEVTCAAVNATGMWLVTSEYRNDGINYPEERLKFWVSKVNHVAPFALNTCVNLSHGGCNVVSLAFNKNADFCVSAGSDQKFRVWKKENVSLTKSKTVVWTCITAYYYSSGTGMFLSHGILNNVKKHDVQTYGPDRHPYLRMILHNDIILKLSNINKEHALLDYDEVNQGMRVDDDTEMGDVAISQDGSLIAAWFGCKLTLWDTHLCNIRTTLSHPALRPKGTAVKFGSKDAAHYLVCTTENCLAVWSLLSLTIKWYVQMKTSCLAADMESNKMAVVTTNNDVFIFTPHSPTPILTHKNLLDPRTGVFKQMAFGTTKDSEYIRLYLVRNDSEIYSIEPEESSAHLEAMSWQNKPLSKFGALLAAQRRSDAAPAAARAPRAHHAPRAALDQVASAAPHMMPPVSLLCTSFLQQLSMEPKEADTNGTTEAAEEAPIELDSSDDEKEIIVDRPTPKPFELWAPNYDAINQKKLNKILKSPFLDDKVAGALFGVSIKK